MIRILVALLKLRLGLLESNAGWVPFWLGHTLDDHAGGRQSAFMGSTPD